MPRPLDVDIPNIVPLIGDNDMDIFGSPDDNRAGGMMNLGVIP